MHANTEQRSACCSTRDDCLNCSQFADTEWRDLEGDDLERFFTARRSCAFASGQSLFAQGDRNAGLYCIRTGTVALRQLDEEGNSVLIGLAYPGDVLGYRALVSEREHRTSAEALGPCQACRIDRDTARRLIQERPQIGFAFLRRSTRDIENMQDALLRTAVLSNRSRLIHLMLSLVEHHGSRADDGAHAIDLPISRRDLASMIGARHETLSRVMSRLEKEDLAQFSGRRVVIPNMEAFAAAAAAC